MFISTVYSVHQAVYEQGVSRLYSTSHYLIYLFRVEKKTLLYLHNIIVCLNDLTLNRETLRERISAVEIFARANSRVTDDATHGVRPARAHTRVSAFLVNARLLIGTFGVADTFGSAARR